MKTSPFARSIAATGVLALLGVGLLASPAAADPTDNNTSTVQWWSVGEYDGTISNAEPFYLDDNLTGEGIQGWAKNSFDGFGAFDLILGEDRWRFFSENRVQTSEEGGTTVNTMTADTGSAFDGRKFEVKLTLTLEGSFAQWNYDIAAVAPDQPDETLAAQIAPSTAMPTPPLSVADLKVRFGGGMGTGYERVFDVRGNALVTSDSDDREPVFAFLAETDSSGTFTGWTVANGDESVDANATGASRFTVTTALADYVAAYFGDAPDDACGGYSDAVSYMTAIAPKLSSQKVKEFDPFGSCMTFAPLALTTGVAINRVLTYTVSSDLDHGFYGDNGSYFSADTRATIDNLPAGLTATAVKSISDNTVIFTLTGTPKTAGTFSPRVVFSNFYAEPAVRAMPTAMMPIVASVPIVVSDPVKPAIGITLGFKPGSAAAAATSTISGEGLQPNSPYTLTMLPKPTELTAGVAAEDGTFAATVPLPAGASVGAHQLILKGTGVDGKPLTASAWFTILRNGTIGGVSTEGPVKYVEPKPTPTPTPTPPTPTATPKPTASPSPSSTPTAPTEVKPSVDATSGETGKLASTGFDPMATWLVAGLLVALGAAFAFIAIRRRRA